MLTDPLTRAIAEVFNLGYEALLSERAAILAAQSADTADLPGAPAAVHDAATAAAGIAVQLLAHVPEELRHAR